MDKKKYWCRRHNINAWGFRIFFSILLPFIYLLLSCPLHLLLFLSILISHLRNCLRHFFVDLIADSDFLIWCFMVILIFFMKVCLLLLAICCFTFFPSFSPLFIYRAYWDWKKVLYFLVYSVYKGPWECLLITWLVWEKSIDMRPYCCCSYQHIRILE